MLFGVQHEVSDSGERCATANKRCDRKRASVNVDVASDSSEDEEGKEVATDYDYYYWFEDGIWP